MKKPNFSIAPGREIGLFYIGFPSFSLGRYKIYMLTFRCHNHGRKALADCKIKLGRLVYKAVEVLITNDIEIDELNL